MFKVGDRVVCVFEDTEEIKKGKTYTFDYYRRDLYPESCSKDKEKYDHVSIVEDDFKYHNESCFISFKEYRKQKLNKICINQ